jgi:transposase
MVPTRRVEHALELCPDCGSHLSGGWVQRSREVIDVPVIPVQVTEHVVVARVCPVCERRRAPRLSLEGVVAGKQRLGVNLVSLITTLREVGRLPVRTIQWYIKTVHQLDLSVGGIVDVIHGVARKAQPAVEQIVDRIRASPMVQADETGWREDGANGYVWTFSTPSEQYFLRRGRDKGVVDEVLDESFSGVLVSDFYAAYNHYPGLKQRCWVHLLRDVHELRVDYPEDSQLAQWAESVHKLYKQARAVVYSFDRTARKRPDLEQRRQARKQLEQKLLKCCRPFVDDPLALQSKLCRRIERFISELFVFVAVPGVPSENNAAERSPRHLVTSRKISGGTRSRQGTDSRMALSSLFGTWRTRGLNPLVQCRQLLASP